MRHGLWIVPILLVLSLGFGSGDRMPYQAAGLTEQEAAEHLLRRFTFGPRPGDVDRAVDMGLEAWLDEQLAQAAPEPVLAERLAGLDALDVPAETLAATYLTRKNILKRAFQAGAISKADSADKALLRDKTSAFAQAEGLHFSNNLAGQLRTQKVIRAVYAENQLAEVLTDFWFNHFNVALESRQTHMHVLTYERDAIRPHILGSFRDLLGATGRHPAMLLYLDNARSTAPEGTLTTMDARIGQRGNGAQRRAKQARARMQAQRDEMLTGVPVRQQPQRGINENYARELMELHTLGVDGGYTQADVENVARAFTGWTLRPAPKPDAKAAQRRNRSPRVGFVTDGLFLFRADAHDAASKTILGTSFPAGGGIEEGERVFDLLAAHPSTAHHIARKLAVRFVSDDPPAVLVDDLAAVFTDTGGDLRATVRALAYHPAFWGAASVGAKVRSPLELTAAALRAVEADVRRPQPVMQWIAQMGQPLYACQAPTGYPDAADAWINAGTLIHRLNFATALADGKLKGVWFNPAGHDAQALAALLASPAFQRR